MIAWGDMHVNQKVVVTMEDGSKVSGTVVFNGVDVYRGGSQDLLMRSEVQTSQGYVYVKADKKIDYKLNAMELECSCVQLKDVLLLPEGALEVGNSQYSVDYYYDYFVYDMCGGVFMLWYVCTEGREHTFRSHPLHPLLHGFQDLNSGHQAW